MTLYPLTPSGVNDKREQLYALPDLDLELQAAIIKADFRSWVNANFSLDSAQYAYLQEMEDTAVAYFGEQCSICFLHRLPIELAYPQPPGPRYAKWTGTRNNIKVLTDSNGHLAVTGSLTFDISYE